MLFRSSRQVAEMLIAQGGDPNARGKGGDTPLHVSAQHGTLSVAAALLAGGARADERDEKGRTPLQLALRSGNFETADLLRSHGGRDVGEGSAG